MAALTYSQLTGTKGATASIKSWVNNSTIEAETIVSEAEAYWNSRLRTREMLSTATGTGTTGQSEIPLPAGVRAVTKFEFTSPTATPLTANTVEQMEQARFYSGTTGLLGTAFPAVFAAMGTSIAFPSCLDQNYTYRFVYYGDMPTLGTATETTWLTAKNPRLVRATCMLYAYDWLRNAPQVSYWQNVVDTEIDAVNAESNAELIGLDQGWSSG
jgi:hypothetical protein